MFATAFTMKRVATATKNKSKFQLAQKAFCQTEKLHTFAKVMFAKMLIAATTQSTTIDKKKEHIFAPFLFKHFVFLSEKCPAEHRSKQTAPISQSCTIQKIFAHFHFASRQDFGQKLDRKI